MEPQKPQFRSTLGRPLPNTTRKKSLLIDLDAQANLTAGLGYDPDEFDSLAPVLQGEKLIEEVILKTSIKNLDLIPADTWLERIEVTGNLASDRYSHERLKRVLMSLNYDYIIIDTPPLALLAHRVRPHRRRPLHRHRYPRVLQRQRTPAPLSFHQHNR